MPNNEILSETRGLRAEVKDLREQLAQNKGVVRRLRILTAAVIVIFLVGGSYIWHTSWENGENAKTSCINANETRKAQRELWDYILGAELKDSNNNPAEVAMSEKILPWIHIVFAERDCTDLSKKYPLPDVPEIPIVPHSEVL